MPTAAIPIAASVAGALVSKSGSKGSTSTTVQSADPWEGVQPALRELYGSALSNFQGPGPQYYPGQTVAPTSDATNLAQQRIWDIATQDHPLIGNAQTHAQDTMFGDYLTNPSTQGLYDFAGADFMESGNPGLAGLESTARGDFLLANPYVDDMFGMAARDVGDQFSKNVLPGVASMFSGSGRYGSDAMASGVGQATNSYGTTLEDLATKIYGGNYANERSMMQGAQSQLGQFGLAGRTLQQAALGELGSQFGRERLNMMGAMNASPQLRAANYLDVGQLANLGATKDLYNQGLINADMERYNFGQNAPNNELAFLSQLLQGAPMGSTGSVTMPGGGGGVIPGALGGFQLGSALMKGFGTGAMPSGFGTGPGGQEFSSFFGDGFF